MSTPLWSHGAPVRIANPGASTPGRMDQPAAALGAAGLAPGYPDAAEVDILISDLNGILRGKRLPLSGLDKLVADGVRVPRSVIGVDIWGEDSEGNGLVFETGDRDGIARAVGDVPVPVPWSDTPRYQLLAQMWEPDGTTPFAIDPRQILAAVCRRYAARGLTPVVAIELEFYLMAGRRRHGEAPRPPHDPGTGAPLDLPQVYSIDDLEAFSEVLSAVRRACVIQSVPADCILAEGGPGQFEITLQHVPDPLLAADHATLFRRLVRHVARHHGLDASFMAKPYGTLSGNGFHVHCSLLDAQGRNLFDDGGAAGSPLLHQAVAGLLDTLPESMLIFAPHLNSYRRYQAGTHAPTRAVWGYENRTAALRIPDGPGSARRFEHRVSGADANPYLVLAAVLAGALAGITDRRTPPPPITGDAYAGPGADSALAPDSAPASAPASAPGADPASTDPKRALISDWGVALTAFRDSPWMRDALGSGFVRAFAACKAQERRRLATMVSDVEYATYLGVL